MITSMIFGILILVEIGLIVYSFVDHENRIYGNIIASVFSVVLALFLAANIAGGTVQDYTADGTAYTIQDAGLSWLLNGVAVVMALITILYIIEIIVTVLNGRNDNYPTLEDF